MYPFTVYCSYSCFFNFFVCFSISVLAIQVIFNPYYILTFLTFLKRKGIFPFLKAFAFPFREFPSGFLLGYVSVQFSLSVMSDSLWPHGLQHARLPCPSPTPEACSDSWLSSWWSYQNISFSIIPFPSCLQSFPASGSFQMSQFFTSGGQSIGVSASASVLPVNIQDWSPLGWTGWISMQSKRCSRVFSNTTVQKH